MQLSTFHVTNAYSLFLLSLAEDKISVKTQKVKFTMYFNYYLKTIATHFVVFKGYSSVSLSIRNFDALER